MKLRIATFAAAIALAGVAAPALVSAQEKTVTVGGAPMFPSKTIVENAVNSKDHTTLVAAVKAAGLVDTLVKPENKKMLTGILTYHVVSGKLNASDLATQIKAGGGKATLKTVAGGSLTASMEGDKVVITDAKGGKSTVTIADVNQSNGVIHVVDTVLMPS